MSHPSCHMLMTCHMLSTHVIEAARQQMTLSRWLPRRPQPSVRHPSPQRRPRCPGTSHGFFRKYQLAKHEGSVPLRMCQRMVRLQHLSVQATNTSMKCFDIIHIDIMIAEDLFLELLVLLLGGSSSLALAERNIIWCVFCRCRLPSTSMWQTLLARLTWTWSLQRRMESFA